MKKFSRIVTVVVIVALLQSFTPDGEKWQEIKPEGSRCSVIMPGTPEKREKLLNSAVGEIKLIMHMYQAPKDGNQDNIAYSVSFMDYPADKITSDSTRLLKEFFDKARDGAINAIQAKLLAESIISYKGYPGREQRVDFKNGLAIIKYRHYLVKNRLYTLQVITETSKNFNLSINKFLDSFKLDGE